MKLRTKFHLASACMISAIVVGMIASLAISEKQRLLSSIEKEQREELDKLARVCEDTMVVFDEAALINYVKNLLRLTGPKVAYAGVVYSDGGAWIYTHGNEPFSYIPSTDDSVQLITAQKTVVQRAFPFQGKLVSELSKPVNKIGHVRLGYSQEMVSNLYRETMQVTTRRLAIVGLAAILFGFVLSHFFSLALSRPIALLMHAAEEIAQGHKGIKIPEGSSDELGRLTKTFNRMSDELAKLDQLKDDFMSHVTHELRSPLTSIIATVELMGEMPQAMADPKLKRSVDRLMFGSERLNKLVDNILDLMKMEAGQMTFDIQPTNMSTILTEMADFFEPRAQEKNLTIRADVPARLPLVLADSERIRQVISNLIHNAVKFTNRGGITLKAKAVEGELRVEVQDTGVGIPADKIASVFKKFECLKDTKDRVEKPVPGSGLGLNIVQNSIKAQNGKIWVESQVDKGTSFIFTLPIAPSEKQHLTPLSSGKPVATSLLSTGFTARTAPIMMSRINNKRV